MILYNVTIKIDHSVEEDWLQWMQEKHIPDVLATGCFKSHQLSRVISMRDDDGTTYAIQYACPDMATLHRYQVQHAAKLQLEHTARYKDKFAAVRTLLETMN